MLDFEASVAAAQASKVEQVLHRELEWRGGAVGGLDHVDEALAVAGHGAGRLREPEGREVRGGGASVARLEGPVVVHPQSGRQMRESPAEVVGSGARRYGQAHAAAWPWRRRGGDQDAGR